MEVPVATASAVPEGICRKHGRSRRWPMAEREKILGNGEKSALRFGSAYFLETT
jgi:hypothetical protein